MKSGQLLRDANRKIIHEHIPKLTKYSILHSQQRLHGCMPYLEVAFRVSALDLYKTANEHNFNELRRCREFYEESLSAYGAIQRAIELGYVDINE